MKILFIGQLYIGSTCVDRMLVLKSLGHEIITFDKTPWLSKGSRLLLSLAHRLKLGPNVQGLNKSIKLFSDTIEKIDLIWIEKSVWVYPSTLRYLKNKFSACLLHYTPDPQILWHKSRHFYQSIPIYDYLITTKPFELDAYKKLGAKQCVFVLQGAGTHFINFKEPIDITYRKDHEVVFVGHYETHYMHRLSSIENLKIWGPGWGKHKNHHSWIGDKFISDGVWGDDYLEVLAGAKIAIGLLSKVIPETTTTRTFEIPAIGTFLLAERTQDHLNLYKEGQEAEFFNSDEEMNEKINYYLSHDFEREKIAEAGKKRFIESGYSTEAQIRKVMDKVLRESFDSEYSNTQ